MRRKEINLPPMSWPSPLWNRLRRSETDTSVKHRYLEKEEERWRKKPGL